ncbi:macrophage migration inhibitory factor (MIF) domain-containing protein [Ditylenchus destructor]|nr:macrophage migration inhibitory factor (MIF) domain-containing protein [Ditylenchus destructor]
MFSLPNEIFSDITNFLPNDDITDLMLVEKLQRSCDSAFAKNQSGEWIVQLNLKKFEPIGSEAKKRMKKAFENEERIPRFPAQCNKGHWNLKMPIVTLTTNIPKCKFPSDFRIEFVKLCEETLKRKGLINFLLLSGADFTFGTLEQHQNNQAAVIVDVEACINYTEAENAWAVELMTEFLTVTLDVPAERVIIVFKSLQPQNVGCGGKLLTQRDELKKCSSSECSSSDCSSSDSDK